MIGQLHFKSLENREYWFYHNDNNDVRDFMRKKILFYVDLIIKCMMTIFSWQ